LTQLVPWKIDSIQFNLAKGQWSVENAMILGEITVNNKPGEAELTHSRTFSKTIWQNEHYSERDQIKVGTEFNTGVPIFAEGKISM